MTDRKTDSAERDTRNQGLQQEDKRLQDPEQRTPHRAVDQTAPGQERPSTPQKDESIQQLENPPQSEGPRERNNDAV
jgi:hypothetical protein